MEDKFKNRFYPVVMLFFVVIMFMLAVKESSNTSQLLFPSVGVIEDTDRVKIRTFEINGLKLTLVKIEGGVYSIGFQPDAPDSDTSLTKDAAQHEVKLSSYYISTTEITQELWQVVMNNNPSKTKGMGLPVTNVTWDQCQEFTKRLYQRTGGYFRLPTEAEWECAARGGHLSRGFKYSGSNTLDSVAWYRGNSGMKRGGKLAPRKVASKQPNELGIYDMAGNVREWCYDWYSPTYYDQGWQTNPHGPGLSDFRVIRGGSYHSNAKGCLSMSRDYEFPELSNDDIGFRLALSEP